MVLPMRRMRCITTTLFATSGGACRRTICRPASRRATCAPIRCGDGRSIRRIARPRNDVCGGARFVARATYRWRSNGDGCAAADSGLARPRRLIHGMEDPIVVPKLSRAKPYNGDPQTQAVSAAIRKLAEAGVVGSKSTRVFQRPTLWASTTGAYIPKSRTNGVRCKGVKLQTGPGSVELFDAIFDAFVAAGWETFAVDRDARSFSVHGPEIAEWAAQRKERDAVSAQLKAEREARTDQKLNRMVELLSDRGVEATPRTSPHSERVEVSLTLSDLERLLGVEAEGGD